MNRQQIAQKLETLLKGAFKDIPKITNLSKNPDSSYLLQFNNPNFPYDNQNGIGVDYSSEEKKLVFCAYGPKSLVLPEFLGKYLSKKLGKDFDQLGNLFVWNDVSFEKFE